MQRMNPRWRQSAPTPIQEEDGEWDWEEDVYREIREVPIPDFSSDLSKEDEQAFTLFRKVLASAFSEQDEPHTEPTKFGKRKQKETKPAKDAKPARKKRAVQKSSPTRRHKLAGNFPDSRNSASKLR